MSDLEIRPRPTVGLSRLVGLLVVLMASILGPTSAAAPAPSTAPAPRRASRASRPAPEPARLPFDREASTSIFLVGAAVHVGNGTVIEGGVVELRGARIVAVDGPERAGALPSGAAVIDLAGKRLTPGLVAAASPLGLVEIDMESATVDAERQDGDPIRAGYDAAMAINADSSLLPVNAIEGITSAAVTPRGGLLSGQVAWIDLVAGDHVGIVARPRIAAAGTFGSAVAGSRAATFARLHEVLDDAALLRDRRGSFDKRQTRELSAHRLDLEALAPVLAGEVPLVMRADRASDLLALAELARSSPLRVAVVGGAQAWKVADVLAAAEVAVIVQPSLNLPQSVDQLGARLDDAALLHAAGVRVGITVLDDPHNARNVTQEAGIAVAHGLPHEAALSAITLELARIYGMEQHYGSIEPGKVANLVVWDGDPFELSQWPRQVYLRGQVIPMRSRQTLLRDRYRDLGRFRDRDE
ncbi:MAG: amidohydrolase family protein [Myxococcales bacterium]|nr:amidohydrolase family protein [Myxococcales bacterium]MCB9717090.1 amidohydrolase family protein [Myxococcales bacterium]